MRFGGEVPEEGTSAIATQALCKFRFDGALLLERWAGESTNAAVLRFQRESREQKHYRWKQNTLNAESAEVSQRTPNGV